MTPDTARRPLVRCAGGCDTWVRPVPPYLCQPCAADRAPDLDAAALEALHLGYVAALREDA